MADDRAPAAHWAMGRALWLRGRHDQSIIELDQAVKLSPNFALAHYNLAFVNATVGDPLAAISSSDHSRSLSPFDPMLFGMLGARAMALVRLGRRMGCQGRHPPEFVRAHLGDRRLLPRPRGPAGGGARSSRHDPTDGAGLPCRPFTDRHALPAGCRTALS
jgi:tetratricopeptide (TPR) repeat protein